MALDLPIIKKKRFDLVVLGHLCLDHVILHEKPYPVRMGGPPVYIGLTARRLGLRTQLIFKYGEDFPSELRPQLSRLALSPDEFAHSKGSTTSYQLQYQDLEHRTLKLLSKAEPITRSDFTSPPSSAAFYAIAPIAGEVSFDLLSWLSTQGAFLFIDVQGFIRQVNANGEIYYSEELKLPRLNPSRTILKGSEEEIKALTHSENPATMVYRLAQYGVNIAIVTRESQGCIVFIKNNSQIWKVSAYTQIDPVDSTGAGDAFTGGFIKGLLETRSIVEACKYGNATASFIIETVGPSGFPTFSQVHDRAKHLSITELPIKETWGHL